MTDGEQTGPGGRHEVDLVLVGAGPVGLYGAYYAGVRGLRVALVDSLPEPGGQVTAMYPEKPIYDIAGFPSVRGRELVDNLVEQADRYGPLYLLGRQATKLERLPGGDGPDRFRLTASDGTVVDCGAVVVTGGIGTFTPRPLPAGEDFLGRGLSYFVPSLADFTGSDVVVVGGGDSACDWVLALKPVARSVTLVHRRTAFRAHAATVDAVRACGATVLTDAQVTGIAGNGTIERVEVTGKNQDRVVLPAQRVVAALGFLADLGPMREWGFDLHDNRHLVVDSRMATDMAGVYAAGDISQYPGKVRLISVGFGEVATAVNNAAVHLDPGASLFPGHSTDEAPPRTATVAAA
ncbi:ferredoxin-NADP reductase [Streptomyces abyssalis]|uniref:Ferredoxin--NADP reductase n=1 Tax=Streptomyces abyssalis TaxID=933944 RepID=A0A1E7JNB2_9ACTN|nr:NAD(P)/FAD-dependent oxidoreductase [Streptomyces abyssalis]OEU86858.1 ferredoxin-NADP reductase [Streptomyces abyssalis]OEU89758.1 ferredoxin-NADP reductase [Streptomyces abyssalis]OEV30898.1 ferredoxin-NADP reductase [Streptomyces nanshensis]